MQWLHKNKRSHAQPGMSEKSNDVCETDLAPAPPGLPPVSRKKQAGVLCSAFIAIALTVGYSQCFGVFQEYYLSPSQDVLVPSPASQSSPPTALLAFVGSLCSGLTLSGSILVNPVISRIEHGIWAPTAPLSTHLWWRRSISRLLLTTRTITISGVLMMTVGLTAASFSNSVWQLLLTQGFLVGFGMSLLYFPLIAPAPGYFTKYRATAMGFVSLLPARLYSFLLQTGHHNSTRPSVLNGRALKLGCSNNITPSTPSFLSGIFKDITNNGTTNLSDLSRRRYRWSHTLARDSGATQRSRWSLDLEALCRVESNRRVADCLGGATESIYRKHEHQRVTCSGLETDIPLLCCGRISPGSCSRDPLSSFPKKTLSALTIKDYVTDQDCESHLKPPQLTLEFLQAAGAQLPLQFIPSYTVILRRSASEGSNLLAASNAINAVSRVLTGYAGDRLGRQNTIVLTLFLASSSVLAFWLSSSVLTATALSSYSLWLAFIVIYSFSAGGYYALFPALIAEVFGIQQYGVVNAFMLLVRGFGTAFGSPVGGRLLGSEKEGSRAYVGVACWDGALLVGATVGCVGVRWAHGKAKGWRWIA